MNCLTIKRSREKIKWDNPIWVFVFLTILVLLVGGEAVADEKSKSTKSEELEAISSIEETWHWPKVTISKETTYFTKPLRADGGVDYIAAFNQRYSEGVTPENNAAVALWQTVGQQEMNTAFQKRHFSSAISELPKDSDYFLTGRQLPETIVELKKPDRGEAWGKRIGEQLFEVSQAPWSKQDYPWWAALLELNAKPLQAFGHGLQRPRLFLPRATDNDGAEIDNSYYTISYRQINQAVTLLSIRSTLRIHDNDIPASWQDIMTLYRLGRLESRLPTSEDMDINVALKIQEEASRAALIFSQYGSLTPTQAREYQAQLKSLPPMRPYWEVSNEWERCRRIVQLLKLVATQNTYDLALRDSLLNGNLSPDGEPKPTRCMTALAKLIAQKDADYTELLRQCNTMHDRLVDACKCHVGVKAFARLAALESEARKTADQAADAVLSDKSDALKRITAKEKAKHIVALTTLPGLICLAKYIVAEEKECSVREDMVRLSLALAGFWADHHTYPKTMAELTPTYIDTIPKDLFTEDDFHYKSTNDGYMLFSVGKNCTNDGGRSFQEEFYLQGGNSASKDVKAWDDIVVCMPPHKIVRKPIRPK